MEKLILSIVPQQDASPALDALTAHGYRATLISSTGGFLRRGYATLLIGVDEARVDQVAQLLKGTCRALRADKKGGEPSEGGQPPTCGVILFVLGVEHFEHL
ncbi:MAG: hypothetical protein GX605_00485 [Chloroflexi bacterium]|nr:hypothetical protein [Chloroflexota bacterium]